MMDLANIFALLNEGAQGTQSIFSGIGDYLSELGLGAGELSVGGVALALVVVWFFVRVIRMLVTILIGVCVLLLVLQFSGVVDLSSLWEMVQEWIAVSTPAAE